MYRSLGKLGTCLLAAVLSGAASLGLLVQLVTIHPNIC